MIEALTKCQRCGTVEERRRDEPCDNCRDNRPSDAAAIEYATNLLMDCEGDDGERISYFESVELNRAEDYPDDPQAVAVYLDTPEGTVEVVVWHEPLLDAGYMVNGET